MKILHMADCHLDSAMETNLPAPIAAKRRAELLLTFKDIVTSAANGGVDLVLIAGDLFDTETPTHAVVSHVLSELSAHEAVDFILIEGNHDKDALSSYPLPPNVHLVPAKKSGAFRYGSTVVYALGYGATQEALFALDIKESDTNILLMHGTLVGAPTSSPETIARSHIEKLPVDYLALGHYHNHRVEQIGARCTACYAGVPEGRGFDETGVCGVVLLDTDSMRFDFLPAARRTLHRLYADISAAQTERDVENAVHAQVADVPEKDMVRLTIGGHYREGLQKDIGAIKAMLSERFYFARVKDESRPALCPEDYKNDLSLRGEFVRRVFASDLSEEDRNRVLMYGLQALHGESIDIDE